MKTKKRRRISGQTLLIFIITLLLLGKPSVSAWQYRSAKSLPSSPYFPPNIKDLLNDPLFINRVRLPFIPGSEEVNFTIVCIDIADKKTIGKFLVTGEKFSMIPTQTILDTILAGDTKGRLNGYSLSPGNPPEYQAVEEKKYPMYFFKNAVSTVTRTVEMRDAETDTILGSKQISGTKGSYFNVKDNFTSYFSLPDYELSPKSPQNFLLEEGDAPYIVYLQKIGSSPPPDPGDQVVRPVEMRDADSNELLGGATFKGRAGEIIQVKEMLTLYPAFNLPGYTLSDKTPATFTLETGTMPYVMYYTKTGTASTKEAPKATKPTVTTYFQCKDEVSGKVLTTIPIYGDPGEYVPTSTLVSLTRQFQIPAYELSPSNQSGYTLQNNLTIPLYYRALETKPSESKKEESRQQDEKKNPEPEEKREEEGAEDNEEHKNDGNKDKNPSKIKRPDWYFDELGEEEDLHPLLSSWNLDGPIPCDKQGDSFDCIDPGNLELEPFELASQRSEYQIPEIEKVEIKEEQVPDNLVWDESIDILVDGLTVSGLTAAISAEENGASVLIVDPSAEKDAGGYLRYSQQVILVATDAMKAAEKLNHLAKIAQEDFGKFSQFYADALLDLPYWLKEHGMESLFEIPDRAEIKEKGFAKLLLKEGSSYRASVIRNLLNFMEAAAKKIEIRCEQSIKRLILHPESGRVLGCELEKDGKTLRIQVRKGLILASEGFENNPDMLRKYFGRKYLKSKFSAHNDGHAIELAEKAGAALLRMNISANEEIHFAAPDEKSTPDYRMPLQGVQMNGRSAIFVNEKGQRFTNESVKPVGGYLKIREDYVHQQIPKLCFAIFDEEGLAEGPLYPGWSSNNGDEVDEGYFFQAESLPELESLLKMENGSLSAEIQKYQNFCRKQEDKDFQRDRSFLKPFSEKGPWFALPLTTVITHSLGGPSRNPAGQVLTKDGKPIPNLYSAGSLGSPLPLLAPLGADMAEALITGRIAGANAAHSMP